MQILSVLATIARIIARPEPHRERFQTLQNSCCYFADRVSTEPLFPLYRLEFCLPDFKKRVPVLTHLDSRRRIQFLRRATFEVPKVSSQI